MLGASLSKIINFKNQMPPVLLCIYISNPSSPYGKMLSLSKASFFQNMSINDQTCTLSKWLD